MESVTKDLESKSKQLVQLLQQEFAGIRTNRPSSQLVEDIVVEYLGEKLKVKQLGSISVNPPREIVISVWDKGAVASVTKAIQDSFLKLNPAVDGTSVRLNMPPLNEERREELIKMVKQTAEKSRIRLRSIRDDANKQIEAAQKEKTISEDQRFKSRKHIQDVIDKANSEIGALVARKEQEITL